MHPGTRATRRRFLEASTAAAMAAWLPPLGRAATQDPAKASDGERVLGIVPFVDEGTFPLETLVGAGLGQRRAVDLATLSRETAVMPQDRFFVRTGCPDLLPETTAWRVRLHGLVERPVEIPVEELKRESAPQGIHLIECAGNSRNARFGLMSAARWTGVPLRRLLERVRLRPQATQVLVSGFDQHGTSDPGSVPGASWIFSLDQLRAAGAFLATGMNGAPLSREHGHPVRLVVPGWYGCTAIKWIDEIVLVGDEAPATPQMREYAGRTHQEPTGPRDRGRIENGRRPEGPELAKDFKAALVDPAALPVRVEKLAAGEGFRYRIRGILWGARIPPGTLRIRVDAAQGFVPVADVEDGDGRTWVFWSHLFQPPRPGRYSIQLAVEGSAMRARRLDLGYYTREIEI
jgi:DMSO/TMAO reductase YedYZ molybdopterin-dependent catalytic subunit